MGLFDGIEHWVERRKAKAAGEQFAAQGGSVLDFLKRNKKWVGIIFTAVSGWAAVKGCPAVFGGLIDPIEIIHKIPLAAGVTCAGLGVFVAMLGSFLTGAGLLTSDSHEKVIQGFKAPEGPPDVMPPAEVKRLITDPKP